MRFIGSVLFSLLIIKLYYEWSLTIDVSLFFGVIAYFVAYVIIDVIIFIWSKN